MTITGEYGIVYKGQFVKNSPEVVAIKTLKGILCLLILLISGGFKGGGAEGA